MKLRAALLMLTPVLLLYLYSFAIPLVLVGRLSFFNSDYVVQQWIGLQNYAQAMHDKYFLKTFANSFWFVLMVVPLKMLLCYKIAVFLISFSKRVQAVGRFVLYIPSLTSGLIMTLIWGWFLLRKGLINSFLALAGIPAVPWLATPWTARTAISMIVIIGGVGFYVIVLSASMLGIPKELHDVALTDGATERQYKRHILLPLMVPTITLCLLLMIVGIMTMWETIYVLTGTGGPQGSTSTPVYDVFQTAFRFGHQSYAAAKGIILMFVIAGILSVKTIIEKRMK